MLSLVKESIGSVVYRSRINRDKNRTRKEASHPAGGFTSGNKARVSFSSEGKVIS